MRFARNIMSVASEISQYDLIVVGGGSGGLAAAKEAVSYGKRVAVLDYVSPTPRGTTWGIGGTCVNVGCIPKKLMHQASILGDSLYGAKKFGWSIPDRDRIEIDWSTLITAVQNHVKSVNWTTRVMLRDNKIDYINGFGEFVDRNTLNAIITKKDQVSVKTLKTDKVIIAVGGRPNYLEVPGCQDCCITSDDLFSLKEPPGKTLIVGAGYIGLECAGFLNGFGFESSVMVRSVPLRGFDQQMARLITQDMENHGVKFLMKCNPVSMERVGKQIKVVYKNSLNGTESSDIFDTVLMACGRHPLTKELKTDKIGLDLAISGKILTDNEQSSIPNIFAVGDVIEGKPELTPVAVQAGKLLAARIFGKSTSPMDYVNVPTTVFTPLEYSCCGYSEEEANSKFGEDNLEVYHGYYKPLEFSVLERDAENCYLKVICKRQEPQTVLGMHYLGKVFY